MEEFITWKVLMTYSSFVTVVHMTTEFTKELWFIKKIKTKYWSFLIAFFLLIVTNLVAHTFRLIDFVLYILSAMAVSLGANGLSDFHKKKE